MHPSQHTTPWPTFTSDISLKWRGSKTTTKKIKYRLPQRNKRASQKNKKLLVCKWEEEATVCYYNQILLSISQVVEFLRMCMGCWRLCPHLITISWNEIRGRHEEPRGSWWPNCGFRKVRPPLCSSMVKCSFLISGAALAHSIAIIQTPASCRQSVWWWQLLNTQRVFLGG